MSQRRLLACALLLIAPTTSPAVFGQVSLQCSPTLVNAKSHETAAPNPQASFTIDDIRESLANRIGSALKVTLEMKDVPDYAFDEEEIPLLDPMTMMPVLDPDSGEPVTRTRVTALPNATNFLLKGTVDFNVGKLVPTPSDLKTAFSTVASSKLFHRSTDPVPGHEQDLWKYFLRIRGKDKLGRAIAGLTVGGALSEREPIDPTLDVPPGLVAIVSRDDKSEGTGSLTLDLSTLFVTGSQRKAAAEALTSYLQAYRPDRAPTVCSASSPNYDSCLRELAGLDRGFNPWAVFAPLIEIKSVDQFDYFQIGGSFRRSALLEESLEVFTATWDFSKVFDRASRKSARISAYEALKKITAKAPETVQSDLVTLASGELAYLKLTANHGVAKGLAWSVVSPIGQPGTCPARKKGEIAQGLALAPDGTVLGYPGPSALAACRTLVAVVDGRGQRDEVECKIS